MSKKKPHSREVDLVPTRLRSHLHQRGTIEKYECKSRLAMMFSKKKIWRILPHIDSSSQEFPRMFKTFEFFLIMTTSKCSSTIPEYS